MKKVSKSPGSKSPSNDLLFTILAGWRSRLDVLGISWREFSIETGISYDTIKRLRRNPTIHTLDEIEKALTKMEE